MENELLEITELRLGLPGDCSLEEKKGKKRAFSEMGSAEEEEEEEEGREDERNGFVGWPPICSYRQKKNNKAKRYVKVSMDGAPFLRKLDLNVYRGYSDLSLALEKLFGSSRIGNIFKKDPDFSEYKPIYEDKDGDWMLAGDVPWEMFMESCRRLRIMKSSPHARLERMAARDSIQVQIQE